MKKCIKCGSNMLDNCCVRCGYMTNGNYISNKEPIDKNKDIKMYNDTYDKMYRNEKKIIPFFIGPLYFSYKNHLILGFIFTLLDILLYKELLKLCEPVGYFTLFFYMIVLFILLIKSLFYAILANSICIKADIYKISKLKDNKDYIIANHKSSSVFKLILNIIFYITVIITLFILYNL